MSESIFLFIGNESTKMSEEFWDLQQTSSTDLFSSTHFFNEFGKPRCLQLKFPSRAAVILNADYEVVPQTNLGDKYSIFNSRSLNELHPIVSNFNSYKQGLALVEENAATLETFYDNTRYFLEQCDRIENFNICFDLDSGFSSVFSEIVTEIHDTLIKRDVYSFPKAVLKHDINTVATIATNLSLVNSFIPFFGLNNTDAAVFMESLVTPLKLRERFDELIPFNKFKHTNKTNLLASKFNNYSNKSQMDVDTSLITTNSVASWTGFGRGDLEGIKQAKSDVLYNIQEKIVKKNGDKVSCAAWIGEDDSTAGELSKIVESVKPGDWRSNGFSNDEVNELKEILASISTENKNFY